MDNTWGMDIKKRIDAKYFIAHSVERNGICIFYEENLYSTYCSGPYKDKEEAEAFLETIEAIDNAST